MGQHKLENYLRNCLVTEYGECALPPPLPFCWCTFFVVNIRSCFLQRSAKDKSLFRCIIYKTIAECVTVHLHFDCLIREYIYSLGLKLGSTLPPHSFTRAYIYSLEKIIIWSPEYCTRPFTHNQGDFSYAIKNMRDCLRGHTNR